MGVYDEHVLPDMASDAVDDFFDELNGVSIRADEIRRERRKRWPNRVATPWRPGLDPADWDYNTSGDCLWVAKDGTVLRLADMDDAHLVNTWRYLVRLNGEPFLMTTPMGRAFQRQFSLRGSDE